MTLYEIRTASEGYVTLNNPEQLLGMAPQFGIFCGERRIAEDGEVECLFLPINKGYYQDKVWLRREQIA